MEEFEAAPKRYFIEKQSFLEYLYLYYICKINKSIGKIPILESDALREKLFSPNNNQILNSTPREGLSSNDRLSTVVEIEPYGNQENNFIISNINEQEMEI